jgi:hypothetical protein
MHQRFSTGIFLQCHRLTVARMGVNRAARIFVVLLRTVRNSETGPACDGLPNSGGAVFANTPTSPWATSYLGHHAIAGS